MVICVDISEDGVAVFLVAHHDAALPAAVLALSDVTFAVGPFLCHSERFLCSNTTYHTYSWIAICCAIVKLYLRKN